MEILEVLQTPMGFTFSLRKTPTAAAETVACLTFDEACQNALKRMRREWNQFEAFC